MPTNPKFVSRRVATAHTAITEVANAVREHLLEQPLRPLDIERTFLGGTFGSFWAKSSSSIPSSLRHGARVADGRRLPVVEDFPRLLDVTLAALERSELYRAQKLIVAALARESFGCGRAWCFVPSSQYLAIVADVDEGDVSRSLPILRRFRVLDWQRAQAEYGDRRGPARFREPRLYFVLADKLAQLVPAPPARSPGRLALRARVVAYLQDAAAHYPRQGQLLPPDADELGEALAEISRADALARAGDAVDHFPAGDRRAMLSHDKRNDQSPKPGPFCEATSELCRDSSHGASSRHSNCAGQDEIARHARESLLGAASGKPAVNFADQDEIARHVRESLLGNSSGNLSQPNRGRRRRPRSGVIHDLSW